MMAWWFLVLLMVCALVVWAVALFLPPGRGQGDARLEGELAQLQREFDRLSLRVDRLLDEQSFLVRMLDDKEQGRLPGGAAGRPAQADSPSEERAE
ncbi:MAG: hypothetical protein ACREKN_06595 [Longimicrobiaceae bacterium]